MGNVNSKSFKESGFTLVELLVAIIITALITAPVTKLMIDSSKNLNRLANEAAYNQQVALFTLKLQKDVQNSQDFFIFNDFPSSTTNLCTTSTSSTWTDPGNTFSRALITFNQTKLVKPDGSSYDPSNLSDPGFMNIQTVRIGYDIKKVAESTMSQQNSFEIWRNQCDATNPTPISSKPVLSLGSVFCQSPSSNYLQFVGIANSSDVGKSNCPIQMSTSSVITNDFAGNTDQLTGSSIIRCTTSTSSNGKCLTDTSANSSTGKVIQLSFLLPVAACSPPVIQSLNLNSAILTLSNQLNPSPNWNLNAPCPVLISPNSTPTGGVVNTDTTSLSNSLINIGRVLSL